MGLSLQVLFDPHCSFLPNVSSVNPGKRIKFVQSAVLDTYRDQFEPYATFGCDMRSHYSGTLFRFPLRSASLEEQSRISKQVGAEGFLGISRACAFSLPCTAAGDRLHWTAAAAFGRCQPHLHWQSFFALLRCAQLLLFQSS